MLASIEEVITDEKTRNSLHDSIKKIPLSDTSTMRRVEALASGVFETLLDTLRRSPAISLAVDELTDNSDVAQLCLDVRFLTVIAFGRIYLSYFLWRDTRLVR